MRSLNQKEKRTLKFGAVCAAIIVGFAFATQWLDNWKQARSSHNRIKHKLQAINVDETKRAGLMSIVPVFAMAFGIAKGFGFEKLLQAQIMEKLPGQEEVLKQVIDFAYTLLENTKGGVVAGVGIAVLFWTVIKVLGNIEKSFNDIWGIKETRKIARKLTDYLSVLLICPVLIIVSSILPLWFWV